MMMRSSVLTRVTSDLTEFSQGMILPSASGVKLPQPESQKVLIQTSKTQVCSAKHSASGLESALEVTSELFDTPTDKPRPQVSISPCTPYRRCPYLHLQL